MRTADDRAADDSEGSDDDAWNRLNYYNSCILLLNTVWLRLHGLIVGIRGKQELNIKYFRTGDARDHKNLAFGSRFSGLSFFFFFFFNGDYRTLRLPSARTNMPNTVTVARSTPRQNEDYDAVGCSKIYVSLYPGKRGWPTKNELYNSAPQSAVGRAAIKKKI